MATSKKSLASETRAEYLKVVSEYLTNIGEEVLITGSNELTLPCVDSDGNDIFVTITFKVPVGSRDGEPYDGYAMAEDYKMKQTAKAEKAREAAEKKAAKIAKDKALREAKKIAKEKKESAGE